MNINTYKGMLIASILLVFTSACKITQPEKLTEVPVITKSENPKSLLWEISGNNLTSSSYLYGTIHMIDADDFFWPKGTLAAVDETEQMYFEIDMSDMQDPMKLMPIFQKAFMNGDSSLSDLMTPDEYNIVKEHFADLGLPLFFLEKIKPMFLTVFATGDFDPSGLENGSIKSYEFEFAKLAEDGNKEMAGLETIEFQISIFDEIPYRDQAQMLLDAIKNSDTENDMFKELVSLYKQEDIYALFEMMQTDQNIDQYDDILLDKRNRSWIPIMEEAMAQKRTFFAVGAGHLAGENGVIQLLVDKGYTVKPYSI